MLESSINIYYDYIIISRFDNYIFENILNVFIAENGVSSISKGEDNFFIISGSILDLVYNYFIELINKNAVTHSYTEYFLSKGLRCHKFYKEIKDQKNHPFLKTTRQLFTPKNHTFHLCNVEDILKICKCEDYILLAALYHSIYGTNFFNVSLNVEIIK